MPNSNNKRIWTETCVFVKISQNVSDIKWKMALTP